MRYILQPTSRRWPLRRLVVSMLVAVVSAGVLLITSGPASASVSKYHGMWVQVSGVTGTFRGLHRRPRRSGPDLPATSSTCPVAKAAPTRWT
jgi:hypothetical protein